MTLIYDIVALVSTLFTSVYLWYTLFLAQLIINYLLFVRFRNPFRLTRHNNPHKLALQPAAWYVTFLEKRLRKDEYFCHYPTDQLFAYIRAETLTRDNLVDWIPDWFADYLLLASSETPQVFRGIKWAVCRNCIYGHCIHNPRPINKSFRCAVDCETPTCIHYNSAGCTSYDTVRHSFPNDFSRTKSVNNLLLETDY